MKKKTLDDTNSSTHYFGILKGARNTPTMVVIINQDGDELLMSKRKYKASADRVYQKAVKLLEKEVMVRTSQSTKNWSADKWFSDVNEM